MLTITEFQEANISGNALLQLSCLKPVFIRLELNSKEKNS